MLEEVLEYDDVCATVLLDDDVEELLDDDVEELLDDDDEELVSCATVLLVLNPTVLDEELDDKEEEDELLLMLDCDDSD